jgi:hypothetical protein
MEAGMSITFQQALDISDDTSKTVLLGNGFSIAGDNIFDYRRLLERAQLDANLMRIFAGLDTADFEIVIEQLNNSAHLVSLFNDENSELSESLLIAARSLQENFANLITTEHASYQQVFRQIHNGAEILERNCFSFLSRFEKIFTTSYDLLLYWTIMLNLQHHRMNHNTPRIPTDDGFRRGGEDQPLRYFDPTSQEVFYLHGSLFLLREDINAIKIERDGEAWMNLLDVIRSNINEGQSPLTVLEGNTRLKLQRISEHAYVTEAFRALSGISGDLFIHGHSLNQTDQHIFNAINRSHNVRRIFISAVSGNDENTMLNDVDADNMFRQSISRFGNRDNREIIIYDGCSANVWG